MTISAAAHAFDRQANNFGVIRLALAFTVVVSHSPELVDGDRSRELLSIVFGTASFGEAAVAGFFVISGYLISKSFIQGSSTFAYFVRRFARIVPGYLLAFLFSTLVAWRVTARNEWSISTLVELGLQMITLRPPTLVGAFAGMPHPIINGSLWTIAYEFRCYVAVAAFGTLGLFRPARRWVFLAIAATLVAADAVGAANGLTWPASSLLGTPDNSTRFFAFFSVGVCYNLFEDKFRFSSVAALICSVLLFCSLFSETLNRPALAIFGGYILFWFATSVKQFRPTAWTDRIDLSYGLYLFAWPIQNFIVWNYRSINPWLLCIMATGLALMMAWFSFRFVEYPSQQFAKKWLATHYPARTSPTNDLPE